MKQEVVVMNQWQCSRASDRMDKLPLNESRAHYICVGID